MLKKSSTITPSQTIAVKQEIKKEVEVEAPKARPGSFAALISQ